MRKAIYPGTFDPITMGHVDVVKRASKLFDKVIVAVAQPQHKEPLFRIEERVLLVQASLNNLPNVEVKAFSGLLVDFAMKEGVVAIIRGIRAVSDFDYEFQIAWMNRKLCPDIETIFLIPSEEYSFLSSSLVREVAKLGGNLNGLVPEVVEKALKRKFGYE